MKGRVRVNNYRNASCISCTVVQEDMLKIGAFIMCTTCFEREFGPSKGRTIMTVPTGVKYYGWLDKYTDHHIEEE